MPTLPKSKPRPWEPQATTKPQEGRTFKEDRYHTARWRKIRKLHFVQNPLCVHCQREGILREATVLDHTHQVSKGADFWDRSNHQGLCSNCHNRKSANERNGKL